VIAPICDSAEVAPCLKSLAISQAGSAFVSAKFVQYSNQDQRISGSQAENDLGLPAGASSSLFSIDLPGWSDKKIAVKPVFQLGLTGDDASRGKFATSQFSMEIAPVVYSSNPNSSFVNLYPATRRASFAGEASWPKQYPLLPQTNSYSSKLWSENRQMAMKANLPEDVRIRVTMEMPKDLPNWYFGQLDNAVVSTVSGAKGNEVTFEATPVTIQKIAFATTLAKSDPNFASGPTYTNVILTPGNPSSIEDLSTFQSASMNKALALSSIWTVGAGALGSLSQSASANQSPELTKCLKNLPNFGGMVTTNAPLFDSDMPKYSNGYLDYKVAGMHYAPDGKTLNTGTYTLTVPAALARCVYGLSNLPVSASVSVIGEAGETRVATTTVKESSAGILTVAARGFTFSSPTIRVKFSQVARTATISCVKGKVTKVVKAVSPKCPLGFKKK
jgi:hypothetical protein